MQAVYDGVGRTTFDASLASLAVRGTLALFARTASARCRRWIRKRPNQAGSVHLTQPNLAHFTRSADRAAWAGSDRSDADGSTPPWVGGITVGRGRTRASGIWRGFRKTVASIVLVP